MFYRNRIVVVGMVCLGLNVVACNSERDVEVKGTVTAPSSLMVGSSLHLEIMDADVENYPTRATATLAALGDFQQTVSLEGDKVHVFVVDDRDGNGGCTAGEAWGITTAAVVGDKVEGISVTLAATGGCPIFEGESE